MAQKWATTNFHAIKRIKSKKNVLLDCLVNVVKYYKS